MINDWTSILDHAPYVLLVMFRIGGLMIFGPVFASPVVPMRVRVMLALVVALASYPLLASQLGPELHIELSLWTLAPLIALELMVGAVIGFAASLPLVGVQTGGLLMGQQMGLGFARFFNPAIDDEADVIGQILFFLALAGFLVIGGHESMMLGVLHSFQFIPPGTSVGGVPLLDLFTGLLASAFEMALRISAPLMALIFLESIAMGFVSKTVPQLNILSLGFPLRILAGIAVIGFGLVVISEVVMETIDHMLSAVFEWIEMPRTDRFIVIDAAGSSESSP